MGQKYNETALVNSLKSLFDSLRIPWYQNIQGPHWGNVRGRPDLEAIWQGITYYIECKHPLTGGKMSTYQEVQRQRIEGAGAPYIRARSVEDVVEAMNLPVLLT